MKFCKHCGAELNDEVDYCQACGYAMPQSKTGASSSDKQNGYGIAGFILSLISLVSGGFLVGLPNLLGIIFSIVGICVGRKNNQKTGMAIAGLVIGIVAIIPMIFVIGMVMAFIMALLQGVLV